MMKSVRDLMSSAVKTPKRNDELLIAAAVMRNERIRHLPIPDEDGRLVGILSQICSSTRSCGRSVTAARHATERSARSR